MHDKSPSPFRSWKYSDSVGCLFLQASTSKTLHQRCFNFQFKFIELQADASLAPTLVDRSMFLFLLDNIYCLFNAAKRNLQKAGSGPNLTNSFHKVSSHRSTVSASVSNHVYTYLQVHTGHGVYDLFKPLL